MEISHVLSESIQNADNFGQNASRRIQSKYSVPELFKRGLDVEDTNILPTAHIVSFNFFPTKAGLDSPTAGFDCLGLKSNKV